MLLALLPLVLAADTGDTADTAGDTAPFHDTAAVAEEVFVQDVGCGGGASAGLVALLIFAGRRARRG